MLKRIALLLTLPVVAGAQTRSFAGCWLRPAPQAQCTGYLVTEATAEFPLFRRNENFHSRFTLGGGFMRNVGPETGVGLVVAWDVGRGWSRPARGELRYRRWLTGAAADFGLGVAQQGITASDGSGRAVRAYGVTGMTGVEWKYIALDLRGEFLEGDGRSFRQAYVGGRATSAAAPVALLIGLGLIIAVVSQTGY
jgi:hypothetical protein